MKITTKLCGGIGNQLFQIAIAYAASKEFKCEYIFVLNEFNGCIEGRHPNNYYNNVYAKISFVDNLNDLSKKVTINERSWAYYSVFNEIKLYTHVDLLIFNGYFQSEQYFQKYKHEIINLFTPTEGIAEYLKKNSNIFERFPNILDQHNCFIGVRRTDYIKACNFHNPCGMHYYKQAMDKMNAKHYYVLSDDFEWCKRNFVGEQYTFLDNIPLDHIQLYVCALFKNYVISNSTFYWWGSYLSIYKNDTNIVVPDKWINLPNYQSIYRPEMKVIERLIETK